MGEKVCENMCNIVKNMKMWVWTHLLNRSYMMHDLWVSYDIISYKFFFFRTHKKKKKEKEKKKEEVLWDIKKKSWQHNKFINL